MAYSLNNFQELLSQSKEQKIKEFGTTKSDLQLLRDNTKKLQTIASSAAIWRKRTSNSILISSDGVLSLQLRKEKKSISSKVSCLWWGPASLLSNKECLFTHTQLTNLWTKLPSIIPMVTFWLSLILELFTSKLLMVVLQSNPDKS